MFDFNKKLREKYILAPACKETYLPMSEHALQGLKGEGVLNGGVSVLRDFYKITRPDPQHNRLIFTLAGRGRLHLPGEEVALTPGDLFVGRKGIPHRYALDGDFWEIAWLRMVPEAGGLDAVIRESPPVRKSSLGPRLKELVLAAAGEADMHDGRSNAALKAIGELLSISLQREFSVAAPAPDGASARFKDLERLIEERSAEGWSLDSLIKESKMFYTPVHFNRLCKRHWGMPAMKKVASIRMLKAKSLLLNTDYPVKTLSRMAGYGNPYAFSSAFKKAWGESPRSARRAVEGKDLRKSR